MGLSRVLLKPAIGSLFFCLLWKELPENYLYIPYDNKVRELIAVKVLHTSLLNITVVAFKVVPPGKLCTDASA
jgi:hypothetical protein